MDNRRNDDERIGLIQETLAEMKVLVKQTHEAMFGNGRPGMKEEHDKMKGVLSVFKFIAGGGGIISVILLIIKIIEFYGR